MPQLAVGAHAGTQIEPERAYFFNGLDCILRREPSGQKQRDADAFPDRATEGPIVSSARAA